MNGTSPPSNDPLDKLEAVRDELKSIPDDEDTGVTKVPSDAPPRHKAALAALFSLPPWGRVVFACVALTIAGVLFWKFGPAILSLLDKLVS